jgi:orotate phosphoribosyltransferase
VSLLPSPPDAVLRDPLARSRAFIDLLVEADVLTFGDFVAKSGRTTPYFVNAGRFRTGSQLGALGRFYAAAIVETFGDDGIDVVFGPAYKGIPLAVATGLALAEHHGTDVGICFDRKEAKEHGEGGSLIGHHPRAGDRVVIVEDVTTAGTSIRATVPLLTTVDDVEVVGLVVGVDRQERGSQGTRSALAELRDLYGFTTTSLTTLDDIVSHLHDREVDGRRVLDDADLDRIERYRATYGALD